MAEQPRTLSGYYGQEAVSSLREFDIYRFEAGTPLVIRTLMEIDCIPAGMELFPAADEEQFEFIKKVIDDCDYYVVIVGGRYGSVSKEGISYTEMEYDYAKK